MAVDMFLKMTPAAGGESRDKDHMGEIDVLSWSWGISNSGTTHMGGGGGAGKANVQDVSLTKYIDSSSTELQLSCCNGKHYDEALITVRKAGETPVEYIKIKMTEVMITSVSAGGSGGEDRLTENVTLNFAKVVVDYTEQDEKGKAKSPAKTYTYNIAENTKE